MSEAGRELCAPRTKPTRPGRALAPELLRRGALAPSGVSKWRAAVLIGIHVIAALHIAHWLQTGETVSPVEPSEAMYTVADGVVNAGAILLVLALLSTLFLGRWFCGWACHLVALQDLCAYALLKIGIRPRPLRSRVLMWIPLGAGIYLFAWPAILRALRGTPAPDLHMELTKSGFWDTFPDWGVALFTFLVCGFAAVYFLGAKGFCTYACPYGGLFALVEPLAPMRIRVTDACRKCGHCSATCTSNVDVAREVHQFGMVVDPGCMKCGDCISVCPENALYYGPGRPAVAKRSRVSKPIAKLRHYTRVEELVMLLVFLASLAFLHGLPELPSPALAWLYEDVQLYARMPLLLALALSGLAAFATVHWIRLVRGVPAQQSFHDRALLDAGGKRTRAGWLALLVTTAVLLLLTHSIWVQVHMFRAGRAFHATAALGNAPWEQTPGQPPRLSATLRDAVAQGERDLAQSEALSLLPDVRIPARRAWLALVRGELDAAHRHLELAMQREPSWPKLPHERARIALVQGDFMSAERFARTATALDPAFAPAAHLLAGLLMKRNEPARAADTLRDLIVAAPRSVEARAQLVTCLEVMGAPSDTEVRELVELMRRMPGADAAEVRAAEALLSSGAVRAVIRLLEAYLAEQTAVGGRALEVLVGALELVGERERAAQLRARASSRG